jgi:hypothetical protein
MVKSKEFKNFNDDSGAFQSETCAKTLGETKANHFFSGEM